ncbi:MAG: LysE family transporter [Bacteroidetes bacterium]|uniref:LysE family transporter n=1 Tax=Candidatus Cryptobacteroides excrementavium TaxID=2840759 RepID=A0A9D9J898_9BACT|nr:LysE family transporter [Candidatus Cryptobacteroides excrementavium]
MLINILKAFIIGICASAPVGPISILVIQKSLSKGHKAGFITGMGACLVDTLFSVIALFFLAIAQQFLNDNRELILIAGGVTVAVLGIFMTKSDPFRKIKADSGSSSVMMKDFMQAVAMGISNPGAILVIFGLFAFFGIGSEEPHDWKLTPIIISVSLGAAVYWFLFTGLLSHFRKKFKMSSLLWISRITSIIVIIIGVALLGEGLFRVIFLGMPLP